MQACSSGRDGMWFVQAFEGVADTAGDAFGGIGEGAVEVEEDVAGGGGCGHKGGFSGEVDHPHSPGPSPKLGRGGEGSLVRRSVWLCSGEWPPHPHCPSPNPVA